VRSDDQRIKTDVQSLGNVANVIGFVFPICSKQLKNTIYVQCAYWLEALKAHDPAKSTSALLQSTLTLMARELAES
jgi:hypothetical protein